LESGSHPDSGILIVRQEIIPERQVQKRRFAMPVDAELRQLLLVFQANEITEYHIYRRLANSIKSPENRATRQSCRRMDKV